MTDEEYMADEEIINIWKNEIHLVEYVNNDYANNVSIDLIRNTIRLINRQKTEIEKLSHKCEDCAGCMSWKCDCSHIREEFAEKLKEKFGISDVIVTIDSKDIDNLVKEMTEDK